VSTNVQVIDKVRSVGARSDRAKTLVRSFTVVTRFRPGESALTRADRRAGYRCQHRKSLSLVTSSICVLGMPMRRITLDLLAEGQIPIGAPDRFWKSVTPRPRQSRIVLAQGETL
jgi:hypothetical protein